MVVMWNGENEIHTHYTEAKKKKSRKKKYNPRNQIKISSLRVSSYERFDKSICRVKEKSDAERQRQEQFFTNLRSIQSPLGN